MRNTSVINLDPIDRKRKKSFIEKILITRVSGGAGIKRMDPYGHYMFCGPQGAGKTASALWYAEKLERKYARKHWNVKLYSNIGVGRPINKEEIFSTINAFNPADKEVRIVILDEIHTYFPKGMVDKATQKIRDDLTAIFSQLRKRHTYILSTAQIYGRLDKSLREQCLFMIDCHLNIWKNRLINEFIPERDILCDDLGRWAGNPVRIYKHGMAKMKYDTYRIIRE